MATDEVQHDLHLSFIAKLKWWRQNLTPPPSPCANKGLHMAKMKDNKPQKMHSEGFNKSRANPWITKSLEIFSKDDRISPTIGLCSILMTRFPTVMGKKVMRKITSGQKINLRIQPRWWANWHFRSQSSRWWFRKLEQFLLKPLDIQRWCPLPLLLWHC